jgi:hypothetical protein
MHFARARRRSKRQKHFHGFLVALLGVENISTLPLQVLNQRFAIASLDGKLANLCPDLGAQGLTETGHFKSLTGNDPVTAEQNWDLRNRSMYIDTMFFSRINSPLLLIN